MTDVHTYITSWCLNCELSQVLLLNVSLKVYSAILIQQTFCQIRYHLTVREVFILLCVLRNTWCLYAALVQQRSCPLHQQGVFGVLGLSLSSPFQQNILTCYGKPHILYQIQILSQITWFYFVCVTFRSRWQHEWWQQLGVVSIFLRLVLVWLKLIPLTSMTS